MSQPLITATISRLPDKSPTVATCPSQLGIDETHGLRPLVTKDPKQNGGAVLVICCDEQNACQQVARILCDQGGWPMAVVQLAARDGGGSAGMWKWMTAKVARPNPISYRGLNVDLFDLLVLVAPASAYRPGGAMCQFLSTLQEFKADLVLLTFQCENPYHEDAARVVHWTGRYPVLGMWLRPIELEFVGAEERIQTFGQSIKAMHPTARRHVSRFANAHGRPIPA